MERYPTTLTLLDIETIFNTINVVSNWDSEPKLAEWWRHAIIRNEKDKLSRVMIYCEMIGEPDLWRQWDG